MTDWDDVAAYIAAHSRTRRPDGRVHGYFLSTTYRDTPVGRDGRPCLRDKGLLLTTDDPDEALSILQSKPNHG